MASARTKKSLADEFVEFGKRDPFTLQPATEIGDGDDLPPDGMRTITLLNLGFCVALQEIGQRPLFQPVNRARKNEKLS